MKKEYAIGETITVPIGHDRVPAGNYVVNAIGHDTSGNKPSEYTKIYQCTEAKSHVQFHINESDLDEEIAPTKFHKNNSNVTVAPKPSFVGMQTDALGDLTDKLGLNN